MFNQIKENCSFVFALFISSIVLFTACKSRVEKIEDNVETTTTPIDSVAATWSNAEWSTYKESTEKRIADNDDKIKLIKEKISKPGAKNLDKLRQLRIDDLKEKNAKLRTKILEYKEDQVQSDWEKFKLEVKQELDTIEQKFKNLDN